MYMYINASHHALTLLLFAEVTGQKIFLLKFSFSVNFSKNFHSFSSLKFSFIHFSKIFIQCKIFSAASIGGTGH